MFFLFCPNLAFRIQVDVAGGVLQVASLNKHHCIFHFHFHFGLWLVFGRSVHIRIDPASQSLNHFHFIAFAHLIYNMNKQFYSVAAKNAATDIHVVIVFMWLFVHRCYASRSVISLLTARESSCPSILIDGIYYTVCECRENEKSERVWERAINAFIWCTYFSCNQNGKSSLSNRKPHERNRRAHASSN